jgi:hypothetical protein
MKRNLTLACSVTESHLKEFLLLKYSAELFHECEWFLSCDEFCYNYLENNFENCKCENLKLHNGKVFGDEEEVSNFYGVIEGKFRATERAITKRGECLLVDSDIIFCSPIPDGKFHRENSAILSPHFQWNSEMDKAWGYFNVGFVYIKDLDFLKSWKEETDKSENQFEQVPIQKVVQSEKYSVGIFPIEFNMGWWRFNNQMSQFRINSFYTSNDLICFDGHIVNSFHFHSFNECHHSKPFKDFILNKIFPRTEDGNLILSEYNRLLLWSAH